jgi:hypothetical protein
MAHAQLAEAERAQRRLRPLDAPQSSVVTGVP